MAVGGPGLAFETWEASKYPATRQSPGRPSALPRVVLNPSNLPAKAIPPGREGPRIAQGRSPGDRSSSLGWRRSPPRRTHPWDRIQLELPRPEGSSEAFHERPFLWMRLPSVLLRSPSKPGKNRCILLLIAKCPTFESKGPLLHGLSLKMVRFYQYFFFNKSVASAKVRVYADSFRQKSRHLPGQSNHR